MEEYTNLELNNMIAELEGYKMVYSNNLGDWSIGTPYCKDDRRYDCFCWSTLGPLMFKYNIDTDHYHSTVSIDSDYTNKPPIAVFSFDYDSEYEYRKSIIMCILKSKNII